MIRLYKLVTLKVTNRLENRKTRKDKDLSDAFDEFSKKNRNETNRKLKAYADGEENKRPVGCSTYEINLL